MKFDQLSEVAKDKARQWWIDGDDQPLETDYIVESLEAIGFIDAEIFYRISYSQGDGACFTSSFVDLDKLSAWMLGETKSEFFADIGTACNANHVELLRFFNIFDELGAKVERCSNFYSHEGTAVLSINGYTGFQTIDQAINEFEQDANEVRRRLSQYIFQLLANEYEYQTSNEVVDESIRANDYDFYENGFIV